MFGKKREAENTKVCPFYFGWRGSLNKQAAIDQARCLEEKCMLWNVEEQDCNINVIAKRLTIPAPIAKHSL